MGTTMKWIQGWIVMAALGASAPALGIGDDIELGHPSYGGSGCPQGTASAALSPDGKSLSILFDDYVVEAGGDFGNRVARKSCNIAIPVHIPQGYSISIFEMDYRGYAYVPRRAQARFNVEYFFAGQRGPRTMKRFRGEYDNDFLVSDKLAAHAMVWSKCGADVNLRVNTSMLAISNRYRDEVFTSIDSADVKAGIVYKIQWRKCNGW